MEFTLSVYFLFFVASWGDAISTANIGFSQFSKLNNPLLNVNRRFLYTGISFPQSEMDDSYLWISHGKAIFHRISQGIFHGIEWKKTRSLSVEIRNEIENMVLMSEFRSIWVRISSNWVKHKDTYKFTFSLITEQILLSFYFISKFIHQLYEFIQKILEKVIHFHNCVCVCVLLCNCVNKLIERTNSEEFLTKKISW